MRYIIVGAGTFGASTAFHLKQTHPDSEVLLLDRTPFPCPSAAGNDLNKVVRAEYSDTLYMELALEAIQQWKSDPVLRQYYHETGILFAGTLESGPQIVENYENLTGESPAIILEPFVAKKQFDGIFRDGDWTGVTSCTWNPEAGWADAEEALRSVIQKAIDVGVKYQTQSVTRVIFGRNGGCNGVQTTGGDQILGDKIVLCTGAYTAELLAESAPDRAEIHVGDRMVAAAAAMCTFRVPEHEIGKFASAPVFVNPLDGVAAESIPPGVKGLCKCTHELSFTNYVYHEFSKQKISIPPKGASHTTWSQDIPESLKAETQAIARKIHGSWVEGMQPESYRMCWDAVTPDQNWVISPHPSAQGLYIASGGSFHAWKFLPIIGKYITQMLDGSLDERKVAQWAWDRSNGGSNMAMFLPSRDLRDIMEGLESNEQ